MATWKEFELFCEDIKQNLYKYDWIVIDPLLGIIIKKEKGKSNETLD